MTDNTFLQHYTTTESSMLLDIIDNPNDYQPLAVEAARFELNNRQLTQEQLADAKAKQDLRRQDITSKQQKIKDIENKFKTVGTSLVDTFNPIQKESPTSDKFIKLISLFICGLFLYQLYKQFGMIKFMFTDDGGKWDFSMFLYFYPFIILPTAGLLFWFRNKLGWKLVTIYFSFTASSAIHMFIMELNRKPTGVPALDQLLPATSPTVYIGTLLVFGGLTWTLCKDNMREIYQIDKESMFISLGIGTGITFLMAIAFG